MKPISGQNISEKKEVPGASHQWVMNHDNADTYQT